MRGKQGVRRLRGSSKTVKAVYCLSCKGNWTAGSEPTNACLLSARLQEGNWVSGSTVYKPPHCVWHVWVDLTGAVQEVPALYIGLSLSSTEGSIVNHLFLQEFSGQENRQGRTEMERKKELCPSPVATIGWSSCSTLGTAAWGGLRWVPDCRDGWIDSWWIWAHRFLFFFFGMLWLYTSSFGVHRKLVGKRRDLGANPCCHYTDFAHSLWRNFGGDSLSEFQRKRPSLSQVSSTRFAQAELFTFTQNELCALMSRVFICPVLQ